MGEPATDRPTSRYAAIGLTATLAGSGLTALAGLLTGLAWSLAAGPTSALDPAAVLVAVTAAAAALLTARLVLCCLACAVAAAAVVAVGPGGTARHAARVAVSTSPRVLRPGLSALLAGSIAIGVAGPALAAAPVSGSSRLLAPPSAAPTPAAVAGPRSVPTPDPGLPSPGWSSLPAPGWLPAAPRRAPTIVQAAPAVHLVTGTGSRSAAPDDEVVVRRGDTLWHLAARSLGPGAATAEIAAEWPRWWRANRDVIGADPDLLLPGTRLRAPASATTDP